MSTDQPTLDEAISRAVEERRQKRADAFEGARYVGGGGTTTELGEPADAGCCLSCGEAVAPKTQRVCGDNHGRVPACKHCSVHDATATAALMAREEGREI